MGLVHVRELLAGRDLGIRKQIVLLPAARAHEADQTGADAVGLKLDLVRQHDMAERGQLRGLDEVAAVIAAAARHGHALGAGARAVRGPDAEGVLLGAEVLLRPGEHAVVEPDGAPLLLRAGIVDVEVRNARFDRPDGEKDRLAHVRQADREVDAAQLRAVRKGVHADLRHARREDDRGQAGAEFKRHRADRRQAALGEVDVFQGLRAEEGIVADRRHAVGHDEGLRVGRALDEHSAVLAVERTVHGLVGGVLGVDEDARECGAVAERVFVELRDGVRQGDDLQLIAAEESVRADGRDAGADVDRHDGLAGPDAAAVTVDDLAGAGDGQQAGGIERPGDAAAVAVGAAGAAVDDIGREGRRDEREHQAQHEQDAQKFLFHAISPLFFRMGAISITKFVSRRKLFFALFVRKSTKKPVSRKRDAG